MAVFFLCLHGVFALCVLISSSKTPAMLDQGPPRGPRFTLITSLKVLSQNTVTLRHWVVKTSNNEFRGDTIWPVTVAVWRSSPDRSCGLWWRSGETIQHTVPPRKPTSVARNDLGTGLTIKITIYWVLTSSLAFRYTFPMSNCFNPHNHPGK